MSANTITPADEFVDLEDDSVSIDECPYTEDELIDSLSRVPPAVSGQGGRAATMRAVWTLRFLAPERAAELLATQYNPRCVPPWRPEELLEMCRRQKGGAPKKGEEAKALDPGLLHLAYGIMLRSLRLTRDDRASLHERGFSDDQIELAGYRSNPTNIDERARVARAVLDAVGERLAEVPGFYSTPEGWDWNAKGEGQLVPVRDRDGRIVGVRHRFERVLKKDGQPQRQKAYGWLSSTPDHPTHHRGACVHHPVFGKGLPVDVVEITEGEYKADRSTLGLGRRVISIPGVGSWALALDEAEAIGAKHIVVSLDAENGNPAVARAVISLCDDGCRRGLQVGVRTWPSTAGKGLDDVIQSGNSKVFTIVEGDDLEDLLETLAGVHKIRRTPSGPSVNELIDAVEEVANDAAPDDDWKSLLQKKKGGLKPTAHNIALYLRHARQWKGAFGWDEFHQRVCWLRRPAWADEYPETSTTNGGEPWTDDDTVRLVVELNRLRMEPGKLLTRQVVQMVARANTVHPVRNYLSALRWDCTPRLRSWTSAYLGTRSTEYEATVGTWWMVQAVRRIMQPGSAAKYILTLEGPQDIGKSTALRVLCGDAWFSDSTVSVGTLNGQLGLAGVWIQELAEGAILRKSDEAELKQFIGQTSDHYVRKFENDAVSVPRQVTFAMSINPKSEGYLHDSTGNVRYWPVRCTKIDFDGLRRDRDQLWAEAVHLYRQGVIPEPRTDAEKALLKEIVEEREVKDVWEPKVEEIVRERDHVTVSEVLTGLEIEVGRQTARDQSRVAALLTGLGFVLSRPRDQATGKRLSVYTRAEKPKPVPLTASEQKTVEDLTARGWVEHVRPDGRRVLMQPAPAGPVEDEGKMAEVISLLDRM